MANGGNLILLQKNTGRFRVAAQGFQPEAQPAAVFLLYRKAIAGLLNGGGQGLGQRQLAIVFAQVSKGGRLAGNTRSAGAINGTVAVNAAIGVQIVITVSSRRCRFAGIDKTVAVFTGVIEQPEAATAKTGAVGFHHAQAGGHRNGGIHGVAAGGENIQPSLSGERMGTGHRGRNAGAGISRWGKPWIKQRAAAETQQQKNRQGSTQ